MTLHLVSSDAIGPGVGQRLADDDDVRVFAGVLLGSTDAAAIVGTGSDHQADILGEVFGSGAGLRLGDQRSADSEQTVAIGENGSVRAIEGAGVMITAFDSSVRNEGDVFGGRFGVVMSGVSSDTRSELVNSGRIQGGEYGVSRGLTGSSGEAFSLDNTGTIESLLFSFHSRDAFSVETIVNDGTMIGDIALSGGDDVYDGRGGSLDGTALGGEGADTLYGGDLGSYRLDGGAGDDVLAGGAGAEALFGGSGADRLVGGDVLDGGIGNDSLNGGGVMNGGAGDDLLEGGSRAEALFGGRGEDILIGGGGADSLRGGGGSDSILNSGGLSNGDAGDDFINGGLLSNGGAGDDVISDSVTSYGGAGNDTLGGGAVMNGGQGDDSLIGTQAVDATMSGGAGDDVITSVNADDVLIGGSGDDYYLVSFAGSEVFEGVGGGQDTIEARTSYTLADGSEIETLILGEFNFAGTGNELANTIVGGVGRNVLSGRGGADTLIGGEGSDTFLFNAALDAGNVDTIVDFEASLSVERIHLDNAVFTSLPPPGLLRPAAFAANADGIATEADDRIVYQTGTGRIFYDADGAGGADGVLFAILEGAPQVSFNDFVVV